LSVEKDIVRLEQVVVTRHHLQIVMWVDRGHFRVPGEELLALGFGEYVRSLKFLKERIRNVHEVLKGSLANGVSVCSVRSKARGILCWGDDFQYV
jgi:hypothetical protein